MLGDDVIFLARFTDGWQVRAAGCSRPTPTRPSRDCRSGHRLAQALFVSYLAMIGIVLIAIFLIAVAGR
ncbi:MAG: hypothetical protein U0R79_07825 [Propionicimonas sp.]